MFFSCSLNQERTLRTRQENEYEQMIRSLQKKLIENSQCNSRTIEELKHDLEQERLLNQKYNADRPTSVPDFAAVHSIELIDLHSSRKFFFCSRPVFHRKK